MKYDVSPNFSLKNHAKAINWQTLKKAKCLDIFGNHDFSIETPRWWQLKYFLVYFHPENLFGEDVQPILTN